MKGANFSSVVTEFGHGGALKKQKNDKANNKVFFRVAHRSVAEWCPVYNRVTYTIGWRKCCGGKERMNKEGESL